MCHGHPYHHTCGHQSVNWHYCPSALIDLETGYETPCHNTTFAASQASASPCPLANCDFRSAGSGGWTCCKCGGRNDSGWCVNASPEPRWEMNPVTNEWEWLDRCDHGCCRSCIKDPQTSSGDSSGKDGGKGKDSQKHRQHSSVASSDVYNIELNYSGKEGKGSSRHDKNTKSSSQRK
ncbi:uncharacterized protein P884DRAFT_228764 [Thermothelomyces heterothallicus CBS 202.75]|uniref:uncharacterized protein n=1 Tax=Thermothelomyces heterothallicus CBS 202.75 TaxID=1149848 RepID=UPI003742B202